MVLTVPVKRKEMHAQVRIDAVKVKLSLAVVNILQLACPVLAQLHHTPNQSVPTLLSSLGDKTALYPMIRHPRLDLLLNGPLLGVILKQSTRSAVITRLSICMN